MENASWTLPSRRMGFWGHHCQGKVQAPSLVQVQCRVALHSCRRVLAWDPAVQDETSECQGLAQHCIWARK